MEDVSQEPVFCRFYLYQTTQRVYLVASDKSGEHWRLLKFDKTAAMGELEVTEDPHHYSKAQCSSLLKTVHEGNLQHGGLQLVCQGYGVIGCFKFLEGYYLCLVTKKRFQGTLCGELGLGTALPPALHYYAYRPAQLPSLAARPAVNGFALNCAGTEPPLPPKRAHTHRQIFLPIAPTRRPQGVWHRKHRAGAAGGVCGAQGLCAQQQGGSRRGVQVPQAAGRGVPLL